MYMWVEKNIYILPIPETMQDISTSVELKEERSKKKIRYEQPLGAFNKTGIDFGGPYKIKQGRMKARIKYYILLFTCLQTRAVHSEVTPGMDTNSIVLAFTCFIAIRGMPTEFLSNNWKTFI